MPAVDGHHVCAAVCSMTVPGCVLGLYMTIGSISHAWCQINPWQSPGRSHCLVGQAGRKPFERHRLVEFANSNGTRMLNSRANPNVAGGREREITRGSRQIHTAAERAAQRAVHATPRVRLQWSRTPRCCLTAFDFNISAPLTGVRVDDHHITSCAHVDVNRRSRKRV